jgi:drug/metabolite transporter (DMT)-like permease
MKNHTVYLSSLALMAFAGNSILCRLALSDGAIDPSAFTTIRIISGAIVLIVLIRINNGIKKSESVEENYSSVNKSGFINWSWLAPTMLFAYAALFSFAYVSLDTGVGALVLFGSVQVSLLLVGLLRGERYTWYEISGLLLACSGLVYLVYPELSKPTIGGFLMMALSGVAWGIYTLAGQGSKQPLVDTNSNFVKAVPMALVLTAIFYGSVSISVFGLLMAVISGAITSGLGYAIWYAALPNLTTSQAGVMQLLVPIIAAAGGIIFAGEVISQRLIVSAILTLGGILLVIMTKKASPNRSR